MMKGLKRLAGGGLLLLEVRGLRREAAQLRMGVERIAAALEAYNAHQWPQHTPATEETPSVEVTYADDQRTQDMMDVEMSLTQARGIPPTEDEILEEYERRLSLRA